ncbi:MAG: hypothetical protein KGL94_12130 [Acidobacteriota bacterium]|nr:hypothetical protein [Acidobacteriota bacterium]
MRTARLLPLLAALLMLAVTAGSAQSADSAPTGLHGFLLRADEPQATSFSRTPSFAWSPIPGALHYEFQLSLGSTFRDNSVIYDDQQAYTPVEAPAITLPWITGTPHALYARVRAITPDGATPWSADFGFDMVPPSPPTPLSSYPGLLRWTPVEGASGYQIWLVDAHKFVQTVTNTLDEREFYTFHQSTSWTGTVRWRIRSLRTDASVAGAPTNGIPAVTYGAWSPTYTSTNPPVTGGPIKLVGTVSDVFSDGSPGSPAHRLMPGFLWTGNQAQDGTVTELYRMYIFTDKQCINRVFTSAVIGSPAYSPRPFGPLSLPATSAGIATARSTYLLDGTEPPGFTYDGQPITTSESAADATPTTDVPAEPGSAPSTGSSAPTGSGTAGASSPSSSPSSPSSGATPGSVTVAGRTGAPIDLWDTNWPESGYYWTVVAVAPVAPNSLYTSVGLAGAKTGDLTLPVTSTQGFNPGDVIQIGGGPTAESGTVTAVSGNTLTLAIALKFGHGSGEAVVRSSGNLEYQDLELPQDVCAAGRVMRFGKESEPSLVSSGLLFATGLSSDGRLTAAAKTTSFYGEPLVSWTPALGAEAYEVQWSKSQYPFNPVTLTSTGTAGVMTSGTSIVFPHDLGPGTWWYRVRGFDYSLPTGAQQMSWSMPARLVVSPPTFKLVGGSATPAKPARPKATASTAGSSSANGLKTVTGTGFTIGMPAGWKRLTLKDSIATFSYANTAVNANVNEVTGSGRGSRTMTQWGADLKTELMSSLGVTPSVSFSTLPSGQAVRLVMTRTVSGTKIVQVQYAVDAGSVAYLFTFTADAAHFAADQPTFARMISSLRLTS